MLRRTAGAAVATGLVNEALYDILTHNKMLWLPHILPEISSSRHAGYIRHLGGLMAAPLGKQQASALARRAMANMASATCM